MSTPFLSLERVTKFFGGLPAVSDLTVTLQKGSIHGLIGPNGAGKTTVFNLITGVYPVTKGRIMIEGEQISDLQPHRIAARGVARTFQNIRLFPSMTVREHVMLGYSLTTYRGLQLLLPASGQSAQAKEAVDEILRQTGLWDQQDRLAITLAYGDQRRVEIARSLACGPRLLLLDEPAAGMNATESRQLQHLVRSLQDQGLTILLIEHDMPFVMDLCDRITVLNFGQKIAEGRPEEIQQNPLVLEAYLGSEEDETGAVSS